MKRRRRGLGAIPLRPCPREGTRVVFSTTPAARMLYSGAPDNGTQGSVVSIPLGGRRATCMGGPGGGLVYVRFDDGNTMGVSSYHLDRVRR